ncbi:hypothetical protein M441DRAFT_64426 [Trichoderma asperellum CBS 433.97]|uniref:Uncharacterized protein n=1 Tax=Trichoderma asperellum (strain ATCC 204424 / CBS 433.97 / NBRC 101777) TaxID=1042311 RepID=A0A2T3ZQX4_TRIA4|nr:hypothetical protein M441DRAFT_64426 [Trichoderma asperellum CBS 433.97]PTB47190.1 hypothetical protein M441DRAFT_64426 [Trichoderma asperellum CBS 433.97]
MQERLDAPASHLSRSKGQRNGRFNRLRYPVLLCAAPVDDASLEIQGRTIHQRVHVARTENAGEASEGPEQTARSRSSRADANFLVSIHARRSALVLVPDPTRLTISSVLSNIRAHVDVADELIILGQSASQDQKRTRPLAR